MRPASTLAASPATVGITQGAVGHVHDLRVAAVWLYWFGESLRSQSLPAGVTASFSPASTTGSSTLTLTVSSTATPGNSSLTITGTSGTLTATTNVAFSIHGPSFTLYSVDPPASGRAAFLPGNTFVEVLDQYGFTGSVNLGCFSGCPPA